MSIRIMHGDILESEAEAIVIPVNCVGVMGAGLAKQLRDRYPHVYADYRAECSEGNMEVGQINVAYFEPAVVYFPTKDHWRNKSKLEWIEQGMNGLEDAIRESKWKSIALPALGCGLGGLNWSSVLPLIEKVTNKFPKVLFEIYPPQEHPNDTE